ncbi:MAG: hypothetical protein JXA92_14425 [candidate division Zixibacteria bacterium]|nr:hypothetical protein [candidate division Zixibacteria bacterium]
MNRTQIGIDCRAEYFYTVRVSTEGDNPRVQTLARFKKEHLKGHEYLSGSEITFCLPDREVMVKALNIKNPDLDDLETIIRFELSQSLLDDESNFVFDYLQVGTNGRYLGLVHRRECHKRLLSFYGFDENDDYVKTARYKMRATALAEGYLKFCQHRDGELIGLVDFNGPTVSICFIYQNRPVDLAYMTPAGEYLVGETAGKNFAADFKTLVNFRLSALAGAGVTVPLAALVVAGDKISESLKTVLEKYFPVGIRSPRIIREYFADPHENTEIPLEKYLVALGLAVN